MFTKFARNTVFAFAALGIFFVVAGPVLKVSYSNLHIGMTIAHADGGGDGGGGDGGGGDGGGGDGGGGDGGGDSGKGKNSIAGELGKHDGA
jgi:hypothetical protein